MIDACVWWAMGNRSDKPFILGSHVEKLTVQRQLIRYSVFKRRHDSVCTDGPGIESLARPIKMVANVKIFISDGNLALAAWRLPRLCVYQVEWRNCNEQSATH